MLIDIITQNAEERLLSLVERTDQENTAWGALYFRRSELPCLPVEEDVLLTVRPVLSGKSASIYFFHDGDIVIAWQGMQKATLTNLCAHLNDRYGLGTDETLHRYYDLQANGEDLRLLCKHKRDRLASPDKLPDVSKGIPSTSVGHVPALKFPPEQIAHFRAAAKGRHARERPELLVVEDQAFSSKLLLSMLEGTYRTHAAANAETALELYLDHAPDISFLDIELPGVNGHELASAISKLDTQAFIIMVSANNHAEDVIRAKENGAKGYIVKPYSKRKVMEAIHTFLHEHNVLP